MKICFLFIIFLLIFVACSDSYSELEKLPTNSVNNQIITRTRIFKKCCVENDSLKIRYILSKNDSVKIKIYSICGELVDTLVDENMAVAGDYHIVWDSNDSLGIYLCKIMIGEKSEVKKIVFCKK